MTTPFEVDLKGLIEVPAGTDFHSMQDGKPVFVPKAVSITGEEHQKQQAGPFEVSWDGLVDKDTSPQGESLGSTLTRLGSGAIAGYAAGTPAGPLAAGVGAALGAVGAAAMPAYRQFQEKYLQEHPEASPTVKGALDIPSAAGGLLEFPGQISQQLVENPIKAATQFVAPTLKAAGIAPEQLPGGKEYWETQLDWNNYPVQSLVGVTAPALAGLGAAKRLGGTPKSTTEVGIPNWTPELTGLADPNTPRAIGRFGPWNVLDQLAERAPTAEEARGAAYRLFQEPLPSDAIGLQNEVSGLRELLGNPNWPGSLRFGEQDLNAMLKLRLQQAETLLQQEGTQTTGTPSPIGTETPTVSGRAQQSSPPLLTEQSAQQALRAQYGSAEEALAAASAAKIGPEYKPVYVPGQGFQLREELSPETSERLVRLSNTPIDTAREAAGTGRESIIQTEEGAKTQGEVDLNMVAAQRAELERMKAERGPQVVPPKVDSAFAKAMEQGRKEYSEERKKLGSLPLTEQDRAYLAEGRRLIAEEQARRAKEQADSALSMISEAPELVDTILEAQRPEAPSAAKVPDLSERLSATFKTKQGARRLVEQLKQEFPEQQFEVTRQDSDFQVRRITPPSPAEQERLVRQSNKPINDARLMREYRTPLSAGRDIAALRNAYPERKFEVRPRQGYYIIRETFPQEVQLTQEASSAPKRLGQTTKEVPLESGYRSAEELEQEQTRDTKRLATAMLSQAAEDLQSTDVAARMGAERWLNEKNTEEPLSFQWAADALGMDENVAAATAEALRSGKADPEAMRATIKLYSGLGFIPEGLKMLKEGLDKLSEINFGEVIKTVQERYMRSMAEVANPQAGLYKNSLNRIRAYEADNDGNALAYSQLSKALYERFPQISEESAKRIRDAREGLTVTLTPHEQEMLKVVQDTFNTLAKQAQEAGVLEKARGEYFSHILLEAPEGKEYETFKYGDRTSLNRKWFIRPRSEENYTARELEGKGWKLLNDPREVLPLYQYYMTREILRANLVRDLFSLRTENGFPAILDARGIPSELYERYLVPRAEVANMIRNYYRRITGNLGLPDIAGNKITESEFRVHADALANLEAVLGRVYTSEGFIKFNSLMSDIRRFNLLNPLVHGYNVLSMALAAGGKDIFQRNWLMNAEKKNMLIDRFVHAGGKYTPLFDLQRLLAKGEYGPKTDTAAIDELWRAAKTGELQQFLQNRKILGKEPSFLTYPKVALQLTRSLSDWILWDKIVAPAQLHIFDIVAMDLAKKFPKLDQETIDRTAAIFVNDMAGTMARWTSTLRQQKFTTSMLLAPRWTPSAIRELMGTLETKELADSRFIPKIFRIEGIAPEMRTEVGKKYALTIARGLIGVVLFTNMMQYAASQIAGQKFQSTQENEEGHKFDINLYKTTPGEGAHYLRSPLFREIIDMTKIVSGNVFEIIANKMHPFWRELPQLIWNVDLFTKKSLYEWDSNKSHITNVAKDAAARGEHLLYNMTPLGTYAGRPEAYRDWTERLMPFLGVWIAHGYPAGGSAEAGEMLKRYVDFKYSSETEAREGKVDIANAIKGNDQETAAALIAEYIQQGRLTPGQVKGVMTSMQAPLLYRIMTRGNQLNSEFLRFLASQPKAEQEKFMKVFQDLQKK